MAPPLVPLLCGGGLAAIHLFAGRLRFLEGIPRSQYLSLAGGVSVAYVFVHALPEIAKRRASLATAAERYTPFGAVAGERIVFLVALFGFTAFYGLERLAARSRRETDSQAGDDGPETRTSAGTFWFHVGSFAVYNALVGHLLFYRAETGTTNLLVYFTAMALHFVVNDHGLREHHRSAYTHVGRWILAAAVLVGVFVSILVAVPEPVVSLLFSFLAGGIILNVIKEELPEQRESSFRAFGVGLLGYTTVLFLI